MRNPILIAFFHFTVACLRQNSADYETKFEYLRQTASVKWNTQILRGKKWQPEKAYERKGRIETLLNFGDYASTEPIYLRRLFYKGASRKITGYYKMETGSEPLTVGFKSHIGKMVIWMDSGYLNSGRTTDIPSSIREKWRTSNLKTEKRARKKIKTWYQTLLKKTCRNPDTMKMIPST